MLIYFTKNLIPAPNCGETFHQHMEPQGFYFTPSNKPFYGETRLNYITGQIESGNILAIEMLDDELSSSWKLKLYNTYKLKGKRLTRKLIKLGYNTILITQKSEWLEAVYLILR